MTDWLKLERLDGNDLPLPKYESTNSAGIDFCACLTRACRLVPEGGIFKTTKEIIRSTLTILPGETIMVSLGFKCEFSHSCVLTLHIRSSIGMRGLELANNTGIIDQDYRGELWAILYNRNKKIPININHGDRIVQGVILAYNKVIISQEKVCNTDRGEGGIGSTGVNSIQKSIA